VLAPRQTMAVSAESTPLGIDVWQRTDPTFATSRNSAQPLINGSQIFPAMEDMLSKAQKSIRLDFYIFSGSEAARLANILVERQKAGVDVRVQLDPHEGDLPVFQQEEQPVIDFLKANGVKVQFYPINLLPSRNGVGEHIDHNKVVIVDGQQALVGGMNIADSFLNNHDVMVKVAGPVVANLKQQFDDVWRLTDKDGTAPQDEPVPAEQGDASMRVIGTGLNGRRTAEAVLIDQIRNAKKRIYVEMFELSSVRLVNEVIAAKQRGVDVRVLSDPGDHSRFLGAPVPTGYPNLPNLYQLNGAGIQVRWYSLAANQVHDHLKLWIVDDTAVVGSVNWSEAAMHTNAETSLQIKGGAAYGRLLNMFADDWNNHSEPVPSPDLYRRGLEAAIRAAS